VDLARLDDVDLARDGLGDEDEVEHAEDAGVLEPDELRFDSTREVGVVEVDDHDLQRTQ
jgi:hypothetical protein